MVSGNSSIPEIAEVLRQYYDDTIKTSDEAKLCAKLYKLLSEYVGTKAMDWTRAEIMIKLAQEAMSEIGY